MDNRDQAELTARWDQHTARHVEIAKGAATAITLLNTGSWIALLSQAGKLGDAPSPVHIPLILLAWGLGALLGTSVWIFIHFNSVYIQAHDFDRESLWSTFGLEATRWLGLMAAIASLVSFGVGVFALASAFKPLS